MNSVTSGLNLLDKIFPKNNAIELLHTIPHIQPKIKESLKLGYSNARPKEAKKVLSPNSPIIIRIAIIKM